MGAWIETLTDWNKWIEWIVASYVGAWIETGLTVLSGWLGMSHPMWVRGLKPLEPVPLVPLSGSHPMWVRGLKLKRSRGKSYTYCRILCGCVD